MRISCRKAEDLMLDELISRSDRPHSVLLQAHLRSCERCRTEQGRLERMAGLLASGGAVAPGHVPQSDRILQAIRQIERASRAAYSPGLTPAQDGIVALRLFSVLLAPSVVLYALSFLAIPYVGPAVFWTGAGILFAAGLCAGLRFDLIPDFHR